MLKYGGVVAFGLSKEILRRPAHGVRSIGALPLDCGASDYSGGHK